MKKDMGVLEIVAVALFLALLPPTAMAYIDPGNGAYMVQALFTVLGAVMFYLRHPVRLFRALWSRLSPGRRQGSQAQVPEPSGSETVGYVVGNKDRVESDSA